MNFPEDPRIVNKNEQKDLFYYVKWNFEEEPK